MLAETLGDLAVGFGIAGMFLFAGGGTWYNPTLFAFLLDDWDVTPWAQLLVSPALLVGGWFLALTVGIGWMAGPGFGLIAAGTGAFCRHEYRDAASAWPSQPVSLALVTLGVVLCLTGVLVAL